jgi:hypothetical protein
MDVIEMCTAPATQEIIPEECCRRHSVVALRQFIVADRKLRVRTLATK